MLRIRIRLNQQQLELIDKVVAQGMAPDRGSLIRKALREHVAKVSAANGRQNRD